MGQSSNAHQSSNPLLYKAKIGLRFLLQRRNEAHLLCQSVPCQNQKKKSKRKSGSLYRVMQNNKTLDPKPTDEKGENL
jgi:hypothetical protein